MSAITAANPADFCWPGAPNEPDAKVTVGAMYSRPTSSPGRTSISVLALPTRRASA